MKNGLMANTNKTHIRIMNKTRTYYQPFFYIDEFGTIDFGNMPSELHSFQAFATREECENWLENNGYDYMEYSIVELHDDDIEDVTIIDEYGDIVEVNGETDAETDVLGIESNGHPLVSEYFSQALYDLIMGKISANDFRLVHGNYVDYDALNGIINVGDNTIITNAE